MHVTTGTRWVRSLMIVTLVLGAAACSSDPPPAGAVKTSTPTASSATPTPTPSVTPVDQQIEAAVRAYYAEIVRAARTDDTSTLQTMVAKSCPCYRTVNVIDKNRRQGEQTPKLAIDLQMVTVHDVVAGSGSAEVKTVDSAYDVLDGSGKFVEHIASARTHLDLSLVRTASGAWIVANFFNLEG
jgi:hypothetical protein